MSFGRFSVIFKTLGCDFRSSDVSIELPISLAICTKKSLKTSHTSFWSKTILSNSDSRISEPPLDLFLDKMGLMVGLKSLDLVPPAQL